MLDDLSRSWQVDEAVDVHVHKGGHQKLTVESGIGRLKLDFISIYIYIFFLPVHNTTMSWYDVSKVLDLECPLEARGKETSKGTDDGGEERHPEGVEEEGVDDKSLFVDQKTSPGSQGLEGQAPLLEGSSFS